MTLSQPGLIAGLQHVSSIGLPQTSCRAFGRRDFMRVDLPAARMMAVCGIRYISISELPIWVAIDAAGGVQSKISNRTIENRQLPRLDSNQDKESQNLLCYRYTTG